MNSSDTADEKEDDQIEPDIYKTAGEKLPAGLLFTPRDEDAPDEEVDITKILDSGITDITNPIPTVANIVYFFAALSYLYSTVKEHPGAFAYFFEKAYDIFAKTQGHKSGDHMTGFVGAELLMKTYENKTNTTLPDNVKAGFQESVEKAITVIKPIKNAYTTSALFFGYDKTNQFVFTMLKTTYKTAELGANWVRRNGWRIESAYQFGMSAANQYIEQITPFALELGEEIAIEFQNHPELITVAGVTTVAGLQVYRNPQRLWDDLKELQDKFADLYDVLMGNYNQILANPKEETLKLETGNKITVEEIDNGADDVDDTHRISAIKRKPMDMFQRKLAALDKGDLNELVRIIQQEKTGDVNIDRTGMLNRLQSGDQPLDFIPTTNVNIDQLVGTNVIPGRGIDGKKNGFVSKKSVPQRTDEFRVFGNKLINIGYLDRNTVSLRTKGGWKIKGTPNKVVGGAVAGVLKAMVDNKQPSAEDVLKLSDDEKDYLNKLTASANVDGFNVPTKKKTEEEKLKHEFEKTRGIIAAGNDNPDLIKQFKRMLVQLIHNKQLPKSQASDVLMELHLLGH